MSEPRIEITENGSYKVTGGLPLQHRAPVVSEKGEPLTWRTVPVEQPDDGDYYLCRCGHSGNKPFCDGTHNKIGFDGTEVAPTSTRAERAKTLGGTGLTVTDDRSICSHAGFCGNKISNVWKMTPQTEDTVVRAQVMAMVERCPSGALAYEVEGAPVEPDLPQAVATTPDGPLFVMGGVPVTRADGAPMETRPRAVLCRCGASSNKPLCDGTHAKIDWKA